MEWLQEAEDHFGMEDIPARNYSKEADGIKGAAKEGRFSENENNLLQNIVVELISINGEHIFTAKTNIQKLINLFVLVLVKQYCAW